MNDYMKHLFVSLSCFIYTVALEICNFSQVSYDQRLQTGIFHTNANGSDTCSRNCMLTTDCNSFNFNRYSGVCELSSETAASKPEHIVHSKGWIQSDISGWLQTLSGACANVTCPPRHKCINIASGYTTCIVSECPPLSQTNVAYSHMNSTSSERGVGTTYKYNCMSGFKLQGTADVTCKADGSWSSPNFTCKDICPTNWKKRIESLSCYFLVSDFTATQSNAETYCENLVPGGHLVEFDDYAENMYVASLWADYINGSIPYIGATKVSGQLIWFKSQKPLTFTSWNEGEPNGGDEENCVQFWTLDKWNDIGCFKSFHFICEVDRRDKNLKSRQEGKRIIIESQRTE